MLNFREWRKWVHSKPGIHRWFIFIVLLRPIVDTFYEMKGISPLLSPLYILAALTAILSIVGIFAGPKKLGYSIVDKIFSFWTITALINMFFIAFLQKDILLITESVLRYTMPFYLYFFIRRFIRDKNDFIRFLQTFLYSEIFVALVFIFELVAGPIRIETSRGFDRYVGLYADNYNYSFFIVLFFLAFTYLYLDKSNKNRLSLFLVLGFEILFLSRVVHIATWGMFAFIFIWFLYNSATINRTIFFLLILMGSIVYSYLGSTVREEYVAPLTGGEMAAIRGEKPIERFAHGRMSRWVLMVPIWKSASAPAKILGLPVDMNRRNLYLITGNVHNDFLRILFLNGVIGLICYLLMLGNIFRKSMHFKSQEKYIIAAGVLVLAMYSVSGNALLYSQLQYVVYSIFAFAVLPLQNN